MATLKHPFDAESLHYLAMKILKGMYPPPSDQYSENLQQLIKKLLSKEISNRPTLVEIVAYSWLQDIIMSVRERFNIPELAKQPCEKNNEMIDDSDGVMIFECVFVLGMYVLKLLLKCVC